MSARCKKMVHSFLLTVFVLVSVLGSFAVARPAHAALPVSVISDITQTVTEVRKTIKEGIKIAVINAAVQSVSYFMRKIAYDSAVWIASGGKGQKPLAFTTGFTAYISNVADEAAGRAIEELGKPYGLNLCKIPDARIDLAMRIGLQYEFGLPQRTAQPSKPTCSFSEFSKNWLDADAWRSQFGINTSIETAFNVSFKPAETDLGLFLEAAEKIDELIAQKKEAAVLDRAEGQGYKAAEGLISGAIKTPASAVKKEAEANTPSEQTKKAEQSTLSIIGSGVSESIPLALSLFLNTLVGEVVNNFREKGMFPFDTGSEGDFGFSDLLGQYEGLVVGGRRAAQTVFSSLLVPKTVEVDRYDVLATFSSCPSSPAADNCVADENLVQAVQEARYGRPITIAEAIEKNWLHGEWKLLSPDRTTENASRNCYQQAYCYSNIVKLRKARVLPLGFEIAALNSNPDRPWTLKQVVDGFNDCNYLRDASGNIIGIDHDPVNKPFCRLIDPTWVLKSPSSRCNAMAFGPNLVFAGGPDRMEECVDLSSCVAYDKNGNCAAYGYCTREKNVWRVEANKCDAQYRTCRSFRDSSGKPVSYLYRTLDTGFCNRDNVGCAAYSLKKNAAGAWVDYAPNDLMTLGQNSVVYFDNEVSSNCSTQSAGCSAFNTAANGDTLYLKKAPYYLGCYDSNPANGLSIEWPQTVADLARIQVKPECSNYAHVCIPDEVNCNWYTPVTFGGQRIPGKYTPATVVEGQVVWNDQCSERCVGYAAYREMPNNYSKGQPVAYIIPSSGARCGVQDEGCTSFTNLSETEGGLEKVEYYSYLRACIRPDANRQKTFYTYEGSTVGGFQLRVFTLEKDTDGSPQYFYKSPDELTNFNAICNETLYRQGLADLDCRQFNDDQGNVYYKLLSRTIAVSDQCTPYRLNEAELYQVPLTQSQCEEKQGYWHDGICGVCPLNGEYRDGQCFYSGLPVGVSHPAGSSQSCSAAVNSCRGYKGNAGNNVRTILNDTFEGVISTPAAGWSGGLGGAVSISNESTHVGEHSLAYTGNGGPYRDLDLIPGRSYEVTFWAKGSAGGTVAVRLENDDPVDMGVVSVGDTWRFYRIGPVELRGTDPATSLRFSINGSLFLDNVVLREVTDLVYLVKNTLTVDSVCDSNVNDNLPGEALGCAEYKTPNNASVYLTGFSYLCREGAIGCTAVYDTYNTPGDIGPRVYNVLFAGASGERVTRTISGREYTCQIPVGQTSCYVNVEGAATSTIIAAGGRIVTSSVYVAADTPSSTPLYLVANREATCNAVDLGCTAAGKRKETASGVVFEEVLVKNDPATYTTALCQSEAVGCNAYSSGDSTLYFKDPAVIGQKVCVYRTGVIRDGVSYSGWFWKGVGRCDISGSYCSSDADCGSGGGKCSGIDRQACYPDFLQAGNEYGLWSYGVTSTYQNFVGECPAEQNGCTQYIDHNDNDTSYYLIENESLKTLKSECNGRVSEKEGCILFDNADQPTKLWHTTSTYEASEEQNNALVAPVSTEGNNNANTVMKVVRDRECGEWLQCRSSHRVWDERTGRFKSVCDAIGRCNRVPESSQDAGAISCVNWVDGEHDYAETVLTEQIYRDRNVGWRGMDFSGYSLLGLYPVEELVQFDLSSDADNPDWRLVKQIPCGGNNCVAGNVDSIACQNVGQTCGFGRRGVCIKSVCITAPDGQRDETLGQAPRQICRAYPEEDSPFPNTVNVLRSQQLSGANLCQEVVDGVGQFTTKKEAYACECDYTKVTYGIGNFNRYYQMPTTSPQTMCVGGVNDGKPNCTGETDCPGGTCEIKKRETQFIGWRGFCLERDYSRIINGDVNQHPCLTWLPVDTISGAADINNQHIEAGFQATAGGRYYCLQARGNQQESGGSYSYDKQVVNQSMPYGVCSDTLTPCSAVPGCSCVYHGDRVKRTVNFSSADPIYMDEIDYIKLVVSGPGANWFENGTYYIRNGAITKYRGPLNGFPGWSVIGKDSAPALASEKSSLSENRYAMSDGTGSGAWYIRYDDGQGDGSDGYQYADPVGTDLAVGGPYRDLLLSTSACNLEENEGFGAGNGTDDYQGCTELHDNFDDGCAVQVSFTGRRLSQIRFVCHTGESGAADAENKTFTVSVGLRETCQVIARTGLGPYDTVGWTHRLWENSKSPYNIATLNYGHGLAQTPFGSLGIIEAPARITHIYSHFDERTFNPPPAVRGAPYSCGEGRNCLDVRSEPPNPNQHGTASGLSLGSGQNFIEELFRTYTILNANFSVSTYSAGIAVNRTESPSFSGVPRVRPLVSCDSTDRCIEDAERQGVTVNNRSSGDVAVNTANKVSLKFFAYADPNRMPLRQIRVDWGDGAPVALDGMFRNHRGLVQMTCGSDNKCHEIPGDAGEGTCATDSDCGFRNRCVPEERAIEFGNIVDRTCDNTYFMFDHIYRCTPAVTSPTPGLGYQPPSVCGPGYPEGCCYVVPRVQVKDNWGWCNGSCSGGPGGAGCYNGDWKGDDNECLLHEGAWTSFTGRVIVPAQ